MSTKATLERVRARQAAEKGGEGAPVAPADGAIPAPATPGSLADPASEVEKPPFWNSAGWAPDSGVEAVPSTRRQGLRDPGRDIFMGRVMEMAGALCGVVAEYRFMRPVFDLEVHTWLRRQRAFLEEEARSGGRVAQKVSTKDIIVEALRWRLQPPSGQFEPKVYAVLAAIARARRQQVGGITPRGYAVQVPSQVAHALDALRLKLGRMDVTLSGQALSEAVILGYVAENRSEKNPIDIELETLWELLGDMGVRKMP